MIVHADGCLQMAACGKTEHTYLVRIDMPFGGVKTHQPQCPLSVFHAIVDRGYSPDLGNVITFEPARDTSTAHRRFPWRSANHRPRCLRDPWRDLVASAGKIDDRRASILSCWRVDRHRRPRDVAHCRTHGRPATSESFPVVLYGLRPLGRTRIWHGSPGHIGICVCPGDGCQTEVPARLDQLNVNTNTESKDQKLHHNPHSLYEALHAENQVGEFVRS